VHDENIIEVAPDPGPALSVLLRHFRREHDYGGDEA
jgi:hypothetical protein